MISRLDASSDRFLMNIAEATKRFHRAQREISSGKRMVNLSDDPDQVGSLLQTKASLVATIQTRMNLGRIKTEVDSAESTLANAVQAMDRARIAGLRGANTIASAEYRTVLGNEIGQIMEQMVSFASTTVEDRYIFSGDQDHAAPYSIDLNNSPAVSAYLGSPATRQTLHPNGLAFRIAKSADEIFDSAVAGKSVFGALQQLRDGLLSNDQAAIEAGLLSLKTAGDHLTEIHAFYGLVQSRVRDTIQDANKMELHLKSKLGALEDADITAAALELSDARFSRDAALTVRGQTPRKTLFDYLG